VVEITWTKKATAQLNREIIYIETQTSSAQADKVRQKILVHISHLEQHPHMGGIESLLSHMKYEYRYVVIWSYKIIYRIAKDKVIISRIFHTSRNPEKMKGI